MTKPIEKIEQSYLDKMSDEHYWTAIYGLREKINELITALNPLITEKEGEEIKKM